MKSLSLFILLFVAQFTLAQIPKPQKNTYVNDFAHVLTKAQKDALNVKIHAIERTTSVQMAIVLVDKLPKNYEIEDFALLIGRKWHVGKNKNGLVYVAAIKQHKQRLEVAQKLTTMVSDSASSEMLSGIKPFFKQKDYDGGLQYLISQIQEVVHPLAVQHPQKIADKQQVPDSKKNFDIWSTIISAIFFFILFSLIVYGVIAIIRSVRGTPTNANTNNYPSNYNSYGSRPGYSTGSNYPTGYPTPPPTSNTGAIVEGLVAGAAAGYAARAIQDHMNENHHNSSFSSTSSDDSRDDDSSYDNSSNNNVSSNDNDSSDWGNWDSGSSDSSYDSGSSSSSDDDGYSGSGASSDW